MANHFEYTPFPLNPLVREYRNPKREPVTYTLELETSSTPPPVTKNYGYDPRYSAPHKIDVFRSVLTDPYEHITLKNIFDMLVMKKVPTWKVLHEVNDEDLRLVGGSFVIRDKSFIPVPATFELSFSIRFLLFGMIGKMDLVSDDVEPQRYLSTQIIGPYEIKDDVVSPLTDFELVCEEFRSRKVRYQVPNHYYNIYQPREFGTKLEWKRMANPLKENEGLDVNQYIQSLNTGQDIKDVKQTVQYKVDLVYIRDTPSVPIHYCVHETQQAYRLFADSLLGLTMLKKGKHMFCNITTAYLELTVGILYLLSQYFGSTIFYRSELQSPKRMIWFVIFKDFRGIDEDELEKLYKLLDDWHAYDPNSGLLLNTPQQTRTDCTYQAYDEDSQTQKFVNRIVSFKDGISKEFISWLTNATTLVGLSILEKWKQYDRVSVLLDRLNKNKQNQLVDKILETNVEASINWCHTHGVMVNNTYDEIGTRLITRGEYMERLFPKERGVDMRKLQISEEGKFSVTKPREAETITRLIAKNLHKPMHNTVITDATANVGGNTINFAKHFQFVNAIEVSPFQCSILKNNLGVYKRRNVKIECKNYLDIAEQLEQDVIYIDPPWGGKSYKALRRVNLYLSSEPISTVLNRLRNSASLFVVKGPANLDLQTLVSQSNMRSFIVYKIRNYLIVMLKPE
jgi:16S rRNA G966 N2-methylase RsmD